MCTVLLPPGDNPIAVNKYIVSYHETILRRSFLLVFFYSFSILLSLSLSPSIQNSLLFSSESCSTKLSASPDKRILRSQVRSGGKVVSLGANWRSMIPHLLPKSGVGEPAWCFYRQLVYLCWKFVSVFYRKKHIGTHIGWSRVSNLKAIRKVTVRVKRYTQVGDSSVAD